MRVVGPKEGSESCGLATMRLARALSSHPSGPRPAAASPRLACSANRVRAVPSCSLAPSRAEYCEGVAQLGFSGRCPLGEESPGVPGPHVAGAGIEASVSDERW